MEDKRRGDVSVKGVETSMQEATRKARKGDAHGVSLFLRRYFHANVCRPTVATMSVSFPTFLQVSLASQRFGISMPIFSMRPESASIPPAASGINLSSRLNVRTHSRSQSKLPLTVINHDGNRTGFSHLLEQVFDNLPIKRTSVLTAGNHECMIRSGVSSFFGEPA
jgi:hypothetical protein